MISKAIEILMDLCQCCNAYCEYIAELLSNESFSDFFSDDPVAAQYFEFNSIEMHLKEHKNFMLLLFNILIHDPYEQQLDALRLSLLLLQTKGATAIYQYYYCDVLKDILTCMPRVGR